MKLPKLMENVCETLLKGSHSLGGPEADRALEQEKWLLTGLGNFFSPWNLKGEYQIKSKKLERVKEGDKKSKQGEAQSLQL